MPPTATLNPRARRPATPAIESPLQPTVSRRKLFRNLAAILTLPFASATYAREVEPFWVQYHDLPVQIPNLSAPFNNFRITQLTDLHASPDVPLSFLQTVVERVNDLNPDLVLLTGDLVTYEAHYVKPICDLLGQLKPQTIVSFGNHDYDLTLEPGRSNQTRVADDLEERLTALGITVLRNANTTIERQNQKLWIVGMEDLWTGRYSPQIGFAGVNFNDPVIAMSHNPDTAQSLDPYRPGLILAGHTHGGQVRLPFLGAPLLPVHNTNLDQGFFKFPNTQLYVSRGVGYLKQVRFLCRPEVPTFILNPPAA